MPFRYPNVSPFATKRRSGARALPSPTVGFRFEMKHLPDDLLRIILAFASPTVGARQLAARARTLDEIVEHSRLEDEPESPGPEKSYCRPVRDGMLRSQTPPTRSLVATRFSVRSR